jgi:hypothetical protein
LNQKTVDFAAPRLRQTAPLAFDHHQPIAHEGVEQPFRSHSIAELHGGRDIASMHATLGQHPHQASTGLTI